MATIKEREDLNYVVGDTDLFPVSDAGGAGLGKGVTAEQIGDAIGPRAVIDAWTESSFGEIFTSPIVGDPDLNNEVSMGTAFPYIMGFQMPKAGFLKSFNMVCQGSLGDGLGNETARIQICSVRQQPLARSGLEIDQILHEDISAVINNATGLVTLLDGLNVAVPPQFVVVLDAAATSTNVKVQACLSAGPMPGLVGFYSPGTGLISAATYSSATLTLDNAGVVSGTDISISTLKGMSTFIEWSGAL